MGADARAGSPDSAQGRYIAALALLRSHMGKAGPTEPLLAAWLATRRDIMAVADSGSADAWRVSCGDPTSVMRLAEVLADMAAQYGMPIVIIEPERPSDLGDARASTSMQASIGDCGIRASDGNHVRARRRFLADQAVGLGMQPDLARDSIDYPDSDYVIRVRMQSLARAPDAVYGIDLHSAECTITFSLLRTMQDESLRSSSRTAQRRSRNPGHAAWDAEAAASSEATIYAVAAVTEEWSAIAEGTRPWIIEVIHPASSLDASLHRASGSPVKVLEHRPGIRSIIECSKEHVPSVIASFGAVTVVHQRPGFVLVAKSVRSMNPTATWILTITLATAAAFAVIAFRRLRLRRSSTLTVRLPSRP
jgi:hypothetical protein